MLSHTEGVIQIAKAIFEANGVQAKVIRPVDYEIAAGLGVDMAQTDDGIRMIGPQFKKRLTRSIFWCFVRLFGLVKKAPFVTECWNECMDILTFLIKQVSTPTLVD